MLQAAGIEVEVNKVHVATEDLARAWRFVSSPTIRVDGADIALELRESSCGSEACTDGCGDQIACRVWVHHGEEYTEPPAEMIVDAILRHVYGTTPEPVTCASLRAAREPAALLRRRASIGPTGAVHPGQPAHRGRRGRVLPARRAGDLLRRLDKGGLLRRRHRAGLWLPVNDHRQRDHPDAEAVWRDLRGPLLAFISRRVSDRGSAEDILQEVMLRIHRHAGELSQVSAVGGWIHEIARNAIIDHYRRAVVRRERPAGTDAELDRPVPPVILEPGPAELRAELASCVDPLVARLPVIYRDALQLTDLAGLTQAEAATRVGLSTSAMKSRVRRARAQLKDLFVRCCEIELDHRGGIVDYQPHNDACDCRLAMNRTVFGPRCRR